MTWLFIHGNSSTIVLLILENRKCFLRQHCSQYGGEEEDLAPLPPDGEACLNPHINELLGLNVGLLSVLLEG